MAAESVAESSVSKAPVDELVEVDTKEREPSLGQIEVPIVQLSSISDSC